MSSLTKGWFKVNEVANKVWRIDDNGEDAIYLIEGKEKSLLIDTGWGIGNLSELVSSLTSYPLIVINTHCHPDHVCANHQFDHIYIHGDDASMMKGNFRKEARLWMLDNIIKSPLPYGFKKDDWINASLKDISYLAKNQQFDLGGRIISVIETPGHTPGSICLFDESEGLLFAGDSIEEGDIWLHCEECLSLNKYFNSIKGLSKIANKIKYIFPSHGNAPIAPRIIIDMANGIEKIVSGKNIGCKIETFFGKGSYCKYDSFGIIYRDNNI